MEVLGATNILLHILLTSFRLMRLKNDDFLLRGIVLNIQTTFRELAAWN